MTVSWLIVYYFTAGGLHVLLYLKISHVFKSSVSIWAANRYEGGVKSYLEQNILPSSKVIPYSQRYGPFPLVVEVAMQQR